MFSGGEAASLANCLPMDGMKGMNRGMERKCE